MRDNGLYQVTAKNAFGMSETLSLPATMKDVSSPFAPLPVDYSRDSQGEVIPNKIGQALESTIVVDEDFVVDRLTLEVHITHSAVDQLTAELHGPGNSIPVLLFERPSKNGAGRDFDHTKFDDAAPEPVKDGIAPFLGTYSVESGSLRQLAGRSARGEWRLRVTDGVQSSGTGQLNNWTISLQPEAPPVRFEMWSLHTGKTDTLTYALTDSQPFQTGKDSFGNVTLSHQRWRQPEDILYRYEVSDDLLIWRRPKNLRIVRQRSSDPVD
jgi:subtilisin-like proprotein convertase family protein